LYIDMVEKGLYGPLSSRHSFARKVFTSTESARRRRRHGNSKD